MNTNRTLLDCEYFPCIDLYSFFFKNENIFIEQFEHFEKATFRNRCEVIGPNGKITLSVPLERGRNQRSIMKDVKICNKEQWQQLHWKTLCASYRRSPYFEYYEHYFFDFFKKPFVFLFDLNIESIALINKILKIEKQYSLSEKYEKTQPETTMDLRAAFNPKQSYHHYTKQYIQNFEERHGFIHNLSILDLVFSCGKKSVELLSN